MKNIISSTPNSQLRPEEAATRPCRMSISLSWNFPMRFETRAPMTQRFFPGSTDFRMGRFSDSQISSKVSTNPVLTNQLKKTLWYGIFKEWGRIFTMMNPKMAYWFVGNWVHRIQWWIIFFPSKNVAFFCGQFSGVQTQFFKARNVEIPRNLPALNFRKEKKKTWYQKNSLGYPFSSIRFSLKC